MELKASPGTEDGVFVGPLTHERAVGKAMKHIDGRSRKVLHTLSSLT
jgi:acyl-CoA reductase-like NAD-dependent aldehyde dehydrogenase